MFSQFFNFVRELNVAVKLGLFAVLIVVTLIQGYRDFLYISATRIWAISGVCFSESIRRRVLWITPLAIVGVIVVAQLQRPVDEQDAIRQTTKFCLFATGLVVTLGTIVLACTNLPREIENRVIFTVVTKPTTRLEIVLGKIVGFARVSASILLIMGIFTWGYLHFRALILERDIKARLDTAGAVEPILKPTLQHYVDSGLLNAKSIAQPTALNIYGELPDQNSSRRYFTSDGIALFPFVLPNDANLKPDGPGIKIRIRVGYEKTGTASPAADAAANAITFHGPAPLISSTQPANGAPAPSGPPRIGVQIFDQTQYSKFSTEINGGKPFVLESANGEKFVEIPFGGNNLPELAKLPMFYIAVLGSTGEVKYWVDDQSVQVLATTADKPNDFLPLSMATDDPSPTAKPSPIFLGRMGTEGQQIKGNAAGNGTVAVFSFNGVTAPSDSSTLPLELRVGIEHGGDENSEVDIPSTLKLQVLNRTTGQLTDAGTIIPENNRPAYASLPAAALAGGKFDLIVRCLSSDQWISLSPAWVSVIKSESYFATNLFKSLFILWLLTLLVISISVFCSTFLSWPIAMVLTLVILLGHWGVQELGDAANAGLGRQFVTDFGVRDPAASQALSSTVEQLNKVLAALAGVLPDINAFPATEDIERGINVPMEKIGDALEMMIGFGLPLTVLAYVFLKNKEVAP